MPHEDTIRRVELQTHEQPVVSAHGTDALDAGYRRTELDHNRRRDVNAGSDARGQARYTGTRRQFAEFRENAFALPRRTEAVRHGRPAPAKCRLP